MFLMKGMTIRQLAMMFMMARKIARSEICSQLQCTESYISKCKKDKSFQAAYKKVEEFPISEELHEYKGLATIYQQMAEFMYQLGVQNER